MWRTANIQRRAYCTLLSTGNVFRDPCLVFSLQAAPFQSLNRFVAPASYVPPPPPYNRGFCGALSTVLLSYVASRYTTNSVHGTTTAAAATTTTKDDEHWTDAPPPRWCRTMSSTSGIIVSITMHHLTCGISSLLHSVNLILFTLLLHGSPHPAHITSSQSPPSLSPPITASTFHSRLKAHLFHKSFPP